MFWLIVLGHAWVPSHDTLGSLFWYKILLSHFQSSGSFPLWLPDLGWGQSVSVSVLAIQSPIHLLLMPLVRLIPSLNSAVLFYVGMLVNELVFLVGIFLFCSRLFNRQTTTIYVCLVLTGTLGWTMQRWWNFQLFYHLPLALFFIHAGLAERRYPKVILGFGIATLFSFVGNLLYVAPLHLSLCGIYALFCARRFGLPRLEKNDRTKSLLFLFFFLLSGLVPAAIVSASDSVKFLAPQRDASGRNSYDVYLEYGRDHTLRSASTMFNAFDLGFSPQIHESDRGGADGNTSTYAGLFFVLFIGLAALFSASSGALPLMALAGISFLLYLSSSSFLAPLLYFVPGFSFFRHFGLLFPMTRFFLIVLTGFGFERLMDLFENRQAKPRLRYALLALTMFSLGLHQFFFLSSLGLGISGTQARYAILLVAFLAFLILALRTYWKDISVKVLACAICAIAAFDAYSYRTTLTHYSMNRVSPEMWDQLNVKAPTFSSERQFVLFESKTFTGWKNIFHDWAGAQNAIAAPFFEADLCHPTYRLDMSAPATEYFLRPLLAGENPSATLMNAIGCRTAKIQTYSTLTVLPSDKSVVESILKSGSELRNASLSEEEKARYLSEPGGTGNFSSSSLVPLTIRARDLHTEFTVNRFQWDRLDIEMKPAPHGRWIYYAQSWSPFWKATIGENKDVPVAKTNFGFQAVWLPATEKKVTFLYLPPVVPGLFQLLWALCLIFFCGFTYLFVGSLFPKLSARFGYIPCITSIWSCGGMKSGTEFDQLRHLDSEPGR